MLTFSFQIYYNRGPRCLNWCDIARVNVNEYQGCVGNSDDLVEIILSHGRERLVPIYVAGDKYAFKDVIDSCMRNHSSNSPQ